MNSTDVVYVLSGGYLSPMRGLITMTNIMKCGTVKHSQTGEQISIDLIIYIY